MDHLFSVQTPPSPVRRALSALSVVAAIGVLWRDVQRRRAGLVRRTPVQVLAATLSLFPAGRRVGDFLLRREFVRCQG